MALVSMQLVEIRANRRGEPRAYLAGTRVRVQDIAADYERHGLTADQIASEYPHLSLAQVHAALAYYFDNQDSVRQHMRDDAAYLESVKSAVSAPPEKNGDAHPVSP